MIEDKASPILNNRGTQEKRIALTRKELVCIIVRFLNDVKEAKDFRRWVDGVFADAERDGTADLLEACIRAERYLQGMKTGKQFEESDLVAFIQAAIRKAKRAERNGAIVFDREGPGGGRLA